MFSCDFHENRYFSQFWFQAFFSGPGFFPRLRVKALSLSSDPGPESIIWGKIVHFLSQMRQNLRQNASLEAKCEAFCLKWGKTSRDVRNLRQNVPGRREFEAKRPGTLGRWARDVGTLGGFASIEANPAPGLKSNLQLDQNTYFYIKWTFCVHILIFCTESRKFQWWRHIHACPSMQLRNNCDGSPYTYVKKYVRTYVCTYVCMYVRLHIHLCMGFEV